MKGRRSSRGEIPSDGANNEIHDSAMSGKVAPKRPAPDEGFPLPDNKAPHIEQNSDGDTSTHQDITKKLRTSSSFNNDINNNNNVDARRESKDDLHFISSSENNRKLTFEQKRKKLCSLTLQKGYEPLYNIPLTNEEYTTLIGNRFTEEDLDKAFPKKVENITSPRIGKINDTKMNSSMGYLASLFINRTDKNAVELVYSSIFNMKSRTGKKLTDFFKDQPRAFSDDDIKRDIALQPHMYGILLVKNKEGFFLQLRVFKHAISGHSDLFDKDEAKINRESHFKFLLVAGEFYTRNVVQPNGAELTRIHTINNKTGGHFKNLVDLYQQQLIIKKVFEDANICYKFADRALFLDTGDLSTLQMENEIKERSNLISIQNAEKSLVSGGYSHPLSSRRSQTMNIYKRRNAVVGLTFKPHYDKEEAIRAAIIQRLQEQAEPIKRILDNKNNQDTFSESEEIVSDDSINRKRP
ncbi:MAG: hypothetical protein H0W64_09375 [Gammaproteobacteria bacterium]|nr:hypothetical protein [Gammaproteobacteria bacterium]